MWPQKTEASPLRYFIRMLPLWCLGNSFVFALLWLLGFDHNPLRLMTFNQVVGLSIELSIFLLIHAFKVRNFWIPSLVGIVVCLAAGKLFAALSGWPPMWVKTFVEREATCQVVGLTVILVPSIAYFFFSRDRLAEAEAARKEAELRRVHQENLALVAHLQMLQAQIEPHFLFNTLANLYTLIENDPIRARSLLERLNDYLRASLDHSRSEGSTLWDECRLLGTYLDIQALRMGNRLSWRLDIPEELRAHPLPPMLLQPLVENAVIHGVEPKIGPGRIEISASQDAARIHLAVCDDGVGFPGAAQGHGIGLNNVRQRLGALFGPEAEMQVRTGWNGTEGVSAELWIPVNQKP